MPIPENIRSIRLKEKLKKSEFARAIGVSPSYITQLEKGKRINPSENFLKRVCAQYGVNRQWLLNDEGPMYEKGIEPRIEDIASMVREILLRKNETSAILMQIIDYLYRRTP